MFICAREFSILVGLFFGAFVFVNHQLTVSDGQTVEQIMASYDGYDAVVSSDQYHSQYSLQVIEHDDYKTVTIYLKDRKRKITFDLLPDYSYHMRRNGFASENQ